MTRKSDAKFEEKLTCGLGNDMRNMARFSLERLKVSKLGLWWDPFIQSRKSMSLKFTVELCAMTMKNDAKFEEELTFFSKLTGIRQILTRALKNLKNFHLNTLLWAEYILFELKKITEMFSFMTLKRDTKFGEELICRFKVDIRNLTSFDTSTR